MCVCVRMCVQKCVYTLLFFSISFSQSHSLSLILTLSLNNTGGNTQAWPDSINFAEGVPTNVLFWSTILPVAGLLEMDILVSDGVCV